MKCTFPICLAVLFLSVSCAMVNTSVTAKTCSIFGTSGQSGSYFQEYEPGAIIYGIDGSPVKVNYVRGYVVDAGKREVIAQVGEHARGGVQYRTFRILVNLEQGKSYNIKAKRTSTGPMVTVNDITGGGEKPVDATIYYVMGDGHGWPRTRG